MFVRKKKNPSGVVSIQVIDKRNGIYRVVKTIGSATVKRFINLSMIYSRLERKTYFESYRNNPRFGVESFYPLFKCPVA
jgi:hypothetical protein